MPRRPKISLLLLIANLVFAQAGGKPLQLPDVVIMGLDTMKIYGERATEPETMTMPMLVVKTVSQKSSTLDQLKRTGFEEFFGHRYNFEIRMGWGNGANQNYYVGYNGKRDLDENSLLNYGAGLGINTSLLPPDSMRERYFSVWTKLIRGFDLNTKFNYQDFRYRMPQSFELYTYQRNVSHLNLNNQFSGEINNNYYFDLYNKIGHLSISPNALSENLMKLEPTINAEFTNFFLAGGFVFDYSSDYVLFGPYLVYSRNRIWPNLKLDRLQMTLGYVYYKSDSVNKKFVAPGARLEFFQDMFSIFFHTNYKIYNLINAFNENRFMVRAGPGQNNLERNKINIGTEVKIKNTPFKAILAYRKVEDFFAWFPDWLYPGCLYGPVAGDVNIITIILTADSPHFIIQYKHDFMNREIPYYYRLSILVGLTYPIRDIVDFGLDINIQGHSHSNFGPSDFLLINANVKKEILKIFSLRFELRNILGEPYEIWPGLEEPGRTYLFSIEAKI